MTNKPETIAEKAWKKSQRWREPTPESLRAKQQQKKRNIAITPRDVATEFGYRAPN